MTQLTIPASAVGAASVFDDVGQDLLPGVLGIEFDSVEAGAVTSRCRAWMVHGGRSTQVWDAEVADESAKTLALFRCTQMVLYPKQAS